MDLAQNLPGWVDCVVIFFLPTSEGMGMLMTFLRCFLIVGVTTTLVLVFCDTQEGQRLLSKAGLFLDEHGIPNQVAEAEKKFKQRPPLLPASNSCSFPVR